MLSGDGKYVLFFGFVLLLYVVPATNWLHEKTPGISCDNSDCCMFSKGKYPAKKRVNQNCYTGNGQEFRGKVNVSRDGKSCMNWWVLGGKFWGNTKEERRQYGIGNHSNCRNPDPEYTGGPWCYMGVGLFSKCDIPSCKDFKEDTTYNTPLPTCDRNASEFVFPDFMYHFRKKIYYVTKRREGYETYKFYDDNMTSFGDPPSENIKTSWNLCTSLKNNDVITFASSYDDKYLFVYFERPGAMIKLNFASKTSWSEVSPHKYKDCIIQATPESSKTPDSKKSFTAMRNVFSFNEPSVVLLLANDKLIRCEWRDGILKFINSTKSSYGICPRGSLHFINKQNVHYQLGIPDSSEAVYSSSDKVVRSVVLAVNENPVLAFPMLAKGCLPTDIYRFLKRAAGYSKLNDKSLVILHPVKSGSGVREICAVDGTRSRIYQLYDGNHLDDIVRWLLNRSRNKKAWLRFHDINLRKSSFCDTVENISCCANIVDQFTSLEKTKLNNNTQTVDNGCDNDMFFVFCQVHISGNSRNCPTVSCTHDIENVVKEQDLVVCEIPLGRDPECSFSLDRILKSENSGTITYKNAEEAAEKMDMIAATIQYQNKNDTKVLSTLVDSVQALKTMNYTTLSRSGAENLISDVMNVVDNIVDDERVDVWMTLQEEEVIVNDNNNGKVETATESMQSKEKSNKLPSDMLFTLETVLGEIASSQIGVQVSAGKNSTFHMDIKTKNIHSTIQNLEIQDDGLTVDESNLLKFDRIGEKSGEQALTIVSRYPNVMHLISQVENAKKETECKTEDCLEKNQNEIEFINSSPVISASVMERGKVLPASVTFVVPYKEDDIPDPRERDSKFYFSCRYLAVDEASETKWDDSGCKVTKVDKVEKLVYCFCNHTTNFAILLQVVPPKIIKADMQKLQTISYIGETISVFCLVFTLTTFIVFRRTLKSPRMVAHFHLVSALIIFHTTQLLVVFAEKEKSTNVLPCIIVTILTHFSLLATFCWMLCEGILLYMSVISVFHSMKYMNVIRYVLGWVIPAFITGITIACGLTRHPYPTCYLQGVGETSCPNMNDDPNVTETNSAFDSADAQPDVHLIQWCWLSTANYLIWAMAAPAVVTLLINAVILAKVSWVIAQTAKSANMYRPTTEQKKEKHIRKCLKGAMLLMPILGVPWIFGLIPQAASHVSLLYAFAIFNSLQGFFILLFYCILSSEVRSAFIRCVRKQTLLHSQNWSSNMSGRHSYADQKSGNRKSVCSVTKSRITSSTDLIKRDSKRKLTTQLSSSSTTHADKLDSDDIFSEKYMNNNARIPLRSESSL
uniref:uncharacterized protein LOC120344819 isoform X1 n=1 Tax=Styela clava TaxID=7725 RepID=UPI00193A271A|nr:uncharacterized protein LOC120344819 isoform X1 [Styela clava]